MSIARTVRSVVFWMHLTVAVAVGAVVIIMSATGAALAYQRPALAMAAARHRVAPPPGGVRLPLDSIVARVSARPAPMSMSDTASVASVTVSHDATLPLSVGLSDRRSLFVDPYTGRVLGTDATLRGFFRSVERWHRSLAIGSGVRSKAGTAITGACNLAFLFLVLSGFYLWWPRRWTPRAFAAVLLFNPRARGRKRHWNWHHVLGFWTAPALLLIVASATFMSYAWPQQLVARAFGVATTSTAGARSRARGAEAAPRARGDRGAREPTAARHVGLDSLIARATPASSWQTIQLTVPRSNARTAAVTVTYGSASRPDRRTQLTLDIATASVVQRQGYDDYDPARKVRAWVRPIHTGEVGGVIGETVAASVSIAAVVLGVTGLLLALSRLRSRIRQRAQAPVSERFAPELSANALVHEDRRTGKISSFPHSTAPRAGRTSP